MYISLNQAKQSFKPRKAHQSQPKAKLDIAYLLQFPALETKSSKRIGRLSSHIVAKPKTARFNLVKSKHTLNLSNRERTLGRGEPTGFLI